LFDALLQRSAQGDAQATMAAIAVYENPAAILEIFRQFYTPEEPQMTPEQMAMMQQQLMQQQMAQGGGQPPSMAAAFGL